MKKVWIVRVGLIEPIHHRNQREDQDADKGKGEERPHQGRERPVVKTRLSEE